MSEEWTSESESEDDVIIETDDESDRHQRPPNLKPLNPVQEDDRPNR